MTPDYLIEASLQHGHIERAAHRDSYELRINGRTSCYLGGEPELLLAKRQRHTAAWWPRGNATWARAGRCEVSAQILVEQGALGIGELLSIRHHMTLLCGGQGALPSY